MRPAFYFWLTSLLSLASVTLARHLPPVPRRDLLPYPSDGILTTDLTIAGGPDSPPKPKDPLWLEEVCKGDKLYAAMVSSQDKEGSYVNPPVSPWTGTLVEEMKTWGYSDVSPRGHKDPDCSLEPEKMATMLKDLKFNTRSSEDGGPNWCFHFKHVNGPTVEKLKDGTFPPAKDQKYKVGDKEYRITGSHYKFIINRQDGVVYFVSRESPANAAYELWDLGDTWPDPKDLPALRASSDVAWGAWNRVKEGSVNNIRYFFSMLVVNDETRKTSRLAHEYYTPPEGKEKPIEPWGPWPGLSFASDTEEYRAHMGSPNAAAVTYFLAQHKAELGDKYVSKVTQFSLDGGFPMLHIMYTVEDVPTELKNNPDPTDEPKETEKPDNDPAKPTGAPLVRRDSVIDFDEQLFHNFTGGKNSGTAGDPDPPPKDPLWQNLKCKGDKLYTAMLSSHAKVSTYVNPVDSPWTGTLEEEMKLWGYNDISEKARDEPGCELEIIFNGESSTKALGLNIKPSTEGGPNYCFEVEHRNGPAIIKNEDGKLPKPVDQKYKVNDREYRVTGAYHTMILNRQQGIIYFSSRNSPENGAKQLWKVDSPKPEDLPALRSSSDIAWGFWNRVQGMTAVKYFMSLTVVNAETRKMMRFAHEYYTPPKDTEKPGRWCPKWPGLTWASDTEEYRALLGSPNVNGAAYFLIQHKEALGGDKYISKITQFGSDGDGECNLLMYVDDVPAELRDKPKSTDPPKDPENPDKPPPGTGSVAHRFRYRPRL